MSRTRKMLIALCTLATVSLFVPDAPSNSVLYASSGGCICTGEAFGNYYNGGFAGSQSSSANLGTATNNVQCASMCQSWIWGVGKSVCNTYGLNGGVGYVVLDWHWYFYGDPNDNGRVIQQYDCGDL